MASFQRGAHLLYALRTLRSRIESQQIRQCSPAITDYASQFSASFNFGHRSFAAGPGSSKKKGALEMTPEIRQQVLDKQRETHAQKLKYQHQLHRERKGWLADLEQQTAATAATAAAKLAEVQAAKALRLAKRARMALIRQEQLAVLGVREREIREKQLAEAEAHRSALSRVYAELQSNRQKWLLEQSRNWIPADQLDARIELALDNPEELF